jgi:hypothetical protein
MPKGKPKPMPRHLSDLATPGVKRDLKSCPHCGLLTPVKKKACKSCGRDTTD